MDHQEGDCKAALLERLLVLIPNALGKRRSLLNEFPAWRAHVEELVYRNREPVGWETRTFCAKGMLRNKCQIPVYLPK